MSKHFLNEIFVTPVVKWTTRGRELACCFLTVYSVAVWCFRLFFLQFACKTNSRLRVSPVNTPTSSGIRHHASALCLAQRHSCREEQLWTTRWSSKRSLCSAGKQHKPQEKQTLPERNSLSSAISSQWTER